MAKQYWLMKSEPNVYSIEDLKRNKTSPWEGVRNYQARNFMRDEMKLGDKVLFYHSNAKPSGVAGIAEVCKTSYPDFFAWDKKSKYFDKKTDPENPTWFMVDVKFVSQFKEVISLQELKEDPALSGMTVTKKGSRLSVHPVDKKHFDHVVALGKRKS